MKAINSIFIILLLLGCKKQSNQNDTNLVSKSNDSTLVFLDTNEGFSNYLIDFSQINQIEFGVASNNKIFFGLDCDSSNMSIKFGKYSHIISNESQLITNSFGQSIKIQEYSKFNYPHRKHAYISITEFGYGDGSILLSVNKQNNLITSFAYGFWENVEKFVCIYYEGDLEVLLGGAFILLNPPEIERYLH
jgi:hypothetical protein